MNKQVVNWAVQRLDLIPFPPELTIERKFLAENKGTYYLVVILKMENECS